MERNEILSTYTKSEIYTTYCTTSLACGLVVPRVKNNTYFMYLENSFH